jgi:hypothetical protein
MPLAFITAARLMQKGAGIYATADDESRRHLNRAFLARIEVDTEEETIQIASPWKEIANAAHYLRARPSRAPKSARPNRVATSRKTTNPGPIALVRDSNMNPLVELRGLEPLTPTLPGRLRGIRCGPQEYVSAGQRHMRSSADPYGRP